jgi:hypothetical protein
MCTNLSYDKCSVQFEIDLLRHITIRKLNMPSVKRIRVDEKVEDAIGDIVGGHPRARSRLSKPLVYSGSLDTFAHQDITPAIGREFEGLQVTDLLKWGDDMIRDLAITGTTESPLINSVGN